MEIYRCIQYLPLERRMVLNLNKTEPTTNSPKDHMSQDRWDWSSGSREDYLVYLYFSKMLSMYLHYFAIILSLEKSLALYLKKKTNPKMSYIQESFVLKFSKNAGKKDFYFKCQCIFTTTIANLWTRLCRPT